MPFQSYNFGDFYSTPATASVLYTYLTHMFQQHFFFQLTPAPALHDGSYKWEHFQTGTYDDFRLPHAGLRISSTEI